jgi:2'-hydroxyisoflavone reductase
VNTTRRRLISLSAAAVPAALAARSGRAAAKPLRILILGGTGFTGPHQVRYALGRGHKVTVFNRGRHPQDWPGEVEELVGDRNTSDLKALAGRDWDVCIDNPTALPFWVRDAGQALKGRIGHYVFISTISVYASNAHPGDDETAAVQPYPGADPFAEREVPPRLYGPLKAMCESEAKSQFGPDHVTVIRPGLIVGPGDETDRFTYWPTRLARGGEVLAPGDGSDPVQFIDARDLAEWTVRMAQARKAGTFNGTGPGGAMTCRQMIEGIGRGVGAAPPLTWVSADWLAAKNVQGWSDLPVWLPGSGDTEGFHRRSIRRAVAAGLTFRPLPVTAKDTLAWWRAQPAERQAKPRTGLTPAREAELLAAWKAKA